MSPEGYTSIPHSTFAEWIAHTYGRAFDLDGSYGAQCWDYASLFWRNVGFAAGYPLTGNGYAYGCWTLKKDENASTSFWLITTKNDIQRGDIIVIDGTIGNPAGHITFAAEDYNGTNTLKCIGQNQPGGAGVIGGGTAVHLDDISISNFLGAFRYKDWSESTKRTKFPWVLYARKLRNKY